MENYTGGFAFTGNALTINASLTAGGAMTVTNAGLFTTAAAGDSMLTGPFLQNGAGLNSLGGDITTANQDIKFTTGITQTGTLAMTTSGGDITLTGVGITPAAAGIDLTLNASRTAAAQNGGDVMLGTFVGPFFLNDLVIDSQGGTGGSVD